MTNIALSNRAQALADGLPKLIIAAERLAFAVAPGLHGRRRGGQGDSFWQFVDWQDGDDARYIDWRRSAQGDRLYSKKREWEAQAAITLWLDDTDTLNFSSHRSLPTKRERASLLLLALAAILLRSGERVALAGVTPPLAGQNALNSLALALQSGGKARIDPAARRISFGDFLQPAPAFSGSPGGAVLHLLDPDECDFPYKGRLIFEGLNQEAPLDSARAQDWQANYLARIAAQRHAVTQAALAAGLTPVFHRTDHPPAHALAALYHALLQK